jgi:hypothetical protein
MSRLADLAKHLVVPDAPFDGLAEGAGHLQQPRLAFDDWQDDLGRLILSKDAVGLFAASICAMSLPRQVGKTYLVGCIAFALCLTQPGTTVIWTAHRGRTATETFRAMKAKAKMPELAAFIDQRVKGGGIRSSNGEQEIEFLNGSRILFGARECRLRCRLRERRDAGARRGAAGDDQDDGRPAADDERRGEPAGAVHGHAASPDRRRRGLHDAPPEAIAGRVRGRALRRARRERAVRPGRRGRVLAQLRQVNPSFPHRVGERAILRNKKGLDRGLGLPRGLRPLG